MKDTIQQRLIFFLESIKMNKSEFGRRIGVSSAYISSMNKSMQPDKIKSIALNFPELNTGWLMTGEGSMLKDGSVISTTVVNYEKRGVPYYDVDFMCGFDIVGNDQTANPSYYIDFKKYNHADFWINVSGDSMRPIIAPGDILAVRQLPEVGWDQHILYGEIYALVTTQNRTIKKVRKSKISEDHLLLVPENFEEFDSQDIEKSAVTHVFQVLGCMKRLM